MDKLLHFAATLGTLKALWVENKPDLVQGYVNTIRRESKPTIGFKIAENITKTEKLIETLEPSAYIFDIKLHDRLDGISMAKLVRKKDPVVPINFVTSYLHEYQKRLKTVSNVAAIVDRLNFSDDTFKEFWRNLAYDAYAYQIYKYLNVAKMTWEEFIKNDSQEVIVRAHSCLFQRMARDEINNRSWSLVSPCIQICLCSFLFYFDFQIWIVF